jgi:hypothetical protein
MEAQESNTNRSRWNLTKLTIARTLAKNGQNVSALGGVIPERSIFAILPNQAYWQLDRICLRLRLFCLRYL